MQIIHRPKFRFEMMIQLNLYNINDYKDFLMMANVIIGGGSGLVGRALTAKLISKNIKVRIISRNPKSSSDLSWKTVKKCGLPENVTTVVNLSGRNIGELNPKFFINSCYKDFLDEVRSSRIDTTTLLAHSLPDTVTKFISASAIGIYKPDVSHGYTEEDSYIDHDFMTRLCRDWEAASSGLNPSKVQSIQVRVGVVLDNHGGVLQNLYPSHRLGLGGPIASGRQWLSWIHIQDIVNLFDFLITNPTAKSIQGPVNATAPFPVRQVNFSRALGEAVGAPLVGRVTTPAFAIRLMFGHERMPILVEGQRVLPKKMQELGFQFAYPHLEDALYAVYGKRPNPVPVD